jgi:hypothetical protein
MSYEGSHNPLLVTATIGTPLAPFNVPVVIPGLPAGINFPFAIPGKAADGFFTNTMSADFASLVTGAEGNTGIVINMDASSNFAITLQHGTIGNRALSILYNAQRLMGTQLPIFTFPVAYRDNNNTPPETHDGFNCLIAKRPDVSYGASIGTLVWGFVSVTTVSNFSSRAV